MKRRLRLIAAASAVALSATACGGSSSESGGDTVLEVQTGQAVDSEITTALTEATDRFMEENPDIEVDLVPASQNYEGDMKVRLASGDVPDIWYTHGWSLARYSEFLMPLNEEPWAKNFNPALDAAMKNDEGEFFALPLDTDISGIVYNGDVLEAAGVDPQQIQTWDDFAKAADAVKANGVAPITVAGKTTAPGNIVDWLAPGAYDDEQLEQLSSGEFAPEGYTKLLDTVATWRDSNYFSPDTSSATLDTVARALGQGDAAFAFGSNKYARNGLQYNPEANVGFMPVPSFGGGEKYLIGGERNAYGIASDTEHPDAAKAYLAFLSEPDNLSKLAEAIGAAPGLTNVEPNLGVFQESYDAFVASDEYELKPYFDRVYFPNGMWSTMGTTVSAVISGQSDVSEAVQQVESEFNSLYGQD